MGIGFSFFAVETLPALSSKPGLGDLPEDCISSILSYLDPPEICKLALLNRSFHGASLADFVWESKLPPNYKFLLHRVGLAHDHDGNNPHVYLSKKDIYTKLCRPNRFDGGTKEVWLDKRWGKVFLSISSKALRITGIDDRRYWNFLPTEESRFKTVAYLQQIWWLEVIGELEFEFPAGGYGLCFRLRLGKPTKTKKSRRLSSVDVDQVHGWDAKPVRFHLATSNGHTASSQCYLHQAAGSWCYYHVGGFVVQKPNTPITIKFSMLQIDCTHSKAGLCIDSVLIYPTELSYSLKPSVTL